MEPTTLFTALTTAAGKAAVGEGVKLLREVTGLQQEQLKLLRAVDAKIDVLLAGPFRAGQHHLEDAFRSWRNPADRDSLLHDARRSFTTALVQESDPLRRSFVAFNLACVWAALGSGQDVLRYLYEAQINVARTITFSARPRGFNERFMDDTRSYLRMEKVYRGLVVLR